MKHQGLLLHHRNVSIVRKQRSTLYKYCIVTVRTIIIHVTHVLRVDRSIVPMVFCFDRWWSHSCVRMFYYHMSLTVPPLVWSGKYFSCTFLTVWARTVDKSTLYWFVWSAERRNIDHCAVWLTGIRYRPVSVRTYNFCIFFFKLKIFIRFSYFFIQNSMAISVKMWK